MVPAPPHLSALEAAAWGELAARHEGADLLALEAAACQLARMRDARRRIEAEGEIVMDSRDRPVPHPALVIERAAQSELRRWLSDLSAGPSWGVS